MDLGRGTEAAGSGDAMFERARRGEALLRGVVFADEEEEEESREREGVRVGKRARYGLRMEMLRKGRGFQVCARGERSVERFPGCAIANEALGSRVHWMGGIVFIAK